MTDQQSTSPSIPDTLEKHIASEEELIKDIVNVYDFYAREYLANEDFIPNNLVGKIKVSINWHALVSAIGHARIDMVRWGRFHLSNEATPKLDRHKYAGFLSKWIAKARPISFEADLSVEIPVSLLRVNAIFALLVFRSYLEFNDGDNATLAAIEKELIYRFHYRDDTGENFAFIAFCYEQAGNWNYKKSPPASRD